MGLVFFLHVGQPRTPIIDEALDETALAAWARCTALIDMEGA